MQPIRTCRRSSPGGEIDPARRNLAFYHIWVQKEAYLKALGQGLSIPLNSFSVSVDPDLSARLIKASDHVEGAQADWQIHRINVPKNYVGAIAADACRVISYCESSA